MEIIAREQELNEIEKILRSSKTELIAIWGRRRVGKTYLVHNAIKRFKDKKDVYLHITGAKQKDGSSIAINQLVDTFKVSIVRSLGYVPVVC